MTRSFSIYDRKFRSVISSSSTNPKQQKHQERDIIPHHNDIIQNELRENIKNSRKGNAHVPYKNEGHGRLPAVNSGNTDSMEYILKIILQHDNLTHMDMSMQEKDKTQKKNRTYSDICLLIKTLCTSRIQWKIFFLNEEIAASIKPLLRLELAKARMLLGKVEMRRRYLLCHFHWIEYQNRVQGFKTMKILSEIDSFVVLLCKENDKLILKFI